MVKTNGGFSAVLFVMITLEFVPTRVISLCWSSPASGNALSNGTAFVNGTEGLPFYNSGEIVTFYCQPGYLLQGKPATRICLEEGTWTDGPNKYTCKYDPKFLIIGIFVALVVSIALVLISAVIIKRLFRRVPNGKSSPSDNNRHTDASNLAMVNVKSPDTKENVKQNDSTDTKLENGDANVG